MAGVLWAALVILALRAGGAAHAACGGDVPPPGTCGPHGPPEAAAAQAAPAPAGPREAGTRAVFDARFIEGLPIIGREYQDVLTLIPGVRDADGDGQASVHGSAEGTVQHRLDGMDITDPLTGRAEMRLDPFVVDRIDVTTEGAPAELGRSAGGFVEVSTRSGSNDFEGRLGAWWTGDLLEEQDDPLEDTVPRAVVPNDRYRDGRIAFSLSGALVKDALWLFGSGERLMAETTSGPEPLAFSTSTTGTRLFAKLSWQAGAAHRVWLQAAADPVRHEGLGLDVVVDPDSGFDQEESRLAAQLRWSAVLSPTMQLQAAVSRLDSRVTDEPSSRHFSRYQAPPFITTQAQAGAVLLRTTYPCATDNCAGPQDEQRFYRFTAATGRFSGPFLEKADEDQRRSAFRSDLSWVAERGPGEHRLAFGIEAAHELHRLSHVLNPFLSDHTTATIPSGIAGFQVLYIADPSPREVEASNIFAGFYASDTWKLAPRLSLSAGVRMERDELNAPGTTVFDPRAERRDSAALWGAVCQEAVRQGSVPLSSNCHPSRPYNGQPPIGISNLQSFLDAGMDGVNDVPAEVASLDVDGDGLIETTGVDAAALFRHFTRLQDLRPGRFELEETRFSPRVSIAWDPWGDGRTTFHARWGRFHDRLGSQYALFETRPVVFGFVFLPSPATRLIRPGAISQPAVASASLVDRDARAPRTDELSLGVERDLGGAWAAGLGYVRRRSRNLLQDRDLNHFTCAQAGSVAGIAPEAWCPDGDAVNHDRFGQPVASFPAVSAPNGIEDLYNANHSFGTVARVESDGELDYTAYELRLRRALARGWQVQGGYTWSRARGLAAAPFSELGDDPSSRSNERGAVDGDQRHSVKLQAVGHLPGGVVLGSAVSWLSGAPYSIIDRPVDLDSAGYAVQRTLYPTGRRNDQRNEAVWTVDARLEKSFSMGRVKASVFVTGANLLDEKTASFVSVSGDGSLLEWSLSPGRRFEIGTVLGF
ncbi:MAG TPA: hypothetical protein VJV23_10405 [Candidatus Polarisedimenticolia bacterium]|nr:hypothetical protein [Candidatus Polarisedimenticolia bacterium]